MTGKLLLLGAGGYGRTVAEAMGGQFGGVAFLDDGVRGSGVLGVCADYIGLAKTYTYAYPAFGDNQLRGAWLNRLEEAGYILPRLVHPSAYVSPSALVEDGAAVLPLACVGAHTVVRRGAIVNMGAIADHDCSLGFCVHLAPGAVVKAGCLVPPMTKVDSGAVIRRAGERNE